MGGAPPAGLSSHMRPWASTLAILGVGLRGNRETGLTGSPQLPQEVPPPPAVSTRNSFLPLNVPEVPPTRRPRDSSVSQATTPRSTSGSLDPRFPGQRPKNSRSRLGPTLTPAHRLVHSPLPTGEGLPEALCRRLGWLLSLRPRK